MKNNKPFKLEIELTLITEQLGTIPKDDELFTNYIADLTKEDEVKPITEEAADKKESRGWTTFHEEDGKPYIFDYMIRGFLKHAGNVLKEEIGIKQVKSKIDDQIFVFPRKIFFDNKKADKPIERSLRVMTMQGPRVSLAKSDYMPAGSKLKFTIECPYSSDFNEEIILKILDHGKYMGLGQFRNGSYGRFEYKVL